MLHPQLFFGLPIEKAFQQAIDQSEKNQSMHFIRTGESPYLQQIEWNGFVYLGKSLGSCIQLAALDALELHIYSLLKKLVPDYPYEQHALRLIAISPYAAEQ